jgi:hypothetical protein
MLTIGIVLIANLSIDKIWRFLLLVLWLADCGWTHWRCERGYARVRGIELDSGGTVKVAGPGGAVTLSGLRTGSVVYRQFAWLRFALPDGSRHAELLIAARASPVDWHRFQLIWHFCRATFGHPGRA